MDIRWRKGERMETEKALEKVARRGIPAYESCCWQGGVGKTTNSSALAILLASVRLEIHSNITSKILMCPIDARF